MSHKTTYRHHVRCDTCGREHHDPASTSAATARAKAAEDGWKHRPAEHVPGVRGRRPGADACDECELPAAPSDPPQENHVPHPHPQRRRDGTNRAGSVSAIQSGPADPEKSNQPTTGQAPERAQEETA